MGNGQWAMGDGQWEMGDGKSWAMGDGNCEMGNRNNDGGMRDGKWAMGSGKTRPRVTRKAQARAARLSHVDARGHVRMVDVSGKPVTLREAVARGRVEMSREALRQVGSGAVKKGDPLQTARLAGIMAAKRTADLIPLCHPLPLTHANVTLTPVANGYEIEARVRTEAQTGVEMEALTAVAVAALTIYDMVKAVDRAMRITGVRLIEKRGGQSGEYKA
jgi:cyclic pyranopterin phosphate synthase